MNRISFLLPLVLFASGCVALQPRQDFPELADQVKQRTGARAVWNTHHQPDAEVEQSIAQMLSQDLSADSAVQIALLNNRHVQATYESLGIAQGELVQAGLLSNPVFSALVRFPDGGAGNANVELSVTQNFLELLSLPLKKKIAEADFALAKAQVGSDLITLATDVKGAFYRLQSMEQMLEMRQAISAASAASAEAAAQIRRAGNSTQLALVNEQAIAAEAKIQQMQAEAELAGAREQLLQLLGVDNGAVALRLPAHLPDLPANDALPDDPEALAARQRFDLLAAEAEVNSARQSLGLTRPFSFLNRTELTLDAEHEPDGGWVAGPGISVPVPLFDTGAARRSIAEGKLRQAMQKAVVLKVQAHSETRIAAQNLHAARTRTEYVRDTLLPLRHTITEQTQLQYNGMLVGVFQLLEARRQEIAAGQSYIESLRDYWLARTELERAVGGQLPLAPIPTPSTTQASLAIYPNH